MLRHLLVLSLLPLGLLSTACGALVFNTTEADLGFVYRDQPRRLVFEFENTSDDTVRILEIEPSCDCTTGQAVPDAVAPHARGKILIFFDPMGYERQGPLREWVRVTTTDSSQRETLLEFLVEIGIGPEPEPRSLTFGKICRGESDTLNLVVRPAPGDTLGVVDAYSDTACIIVRETGTDAHGAHEFAVIASNREGCGRVAGLVTILTTDTLRKEIRIPVAVSLVGRIIVDPDIIAFGPTLPGASIAQVVRVYSKDGLKFTVPKVTSSTQYLEPTVVPLSDGSCELRLRVKDGSPAGRVSGEIKLETDCPDEPPVDIKVTGYIRSSEK